MDSHLALGKRYVKILSVIETEKPWPIIGHTSAVQLLQRSLQRTGGRPHHANLFLGAPQLGKSTLVRVFAQVVLCTDDVQRPCGVCRACRLMARGSHPDFHLIQPLDKGGQVDRLDGTLRVEQATGLIREAALRPVESPYKIFHIQDFHQAHEAFANKLLKTLEEPPESVVLCLTATDRNSLLPTIVSRCQVIELRPLRPQLIAQALVEQGHAAPDQAMLLARLANGRLGWAVQQLSHADGQQERLTHLQSLWQLLTADRIARLAFAEQLAANRKSQHLFGLLEVWTTWWRDVLLAQAGCGELCANIDQQTELTRQAQLVPLAEIQRYLQTLRRIEGYLHHTVNTRLALDVLVLQIPRLHDLRGV